MALTLAKQPQIKITTVEESGVDEDEESPLKSKRP